LVGEKGYAEQKSFVAERGTHQYGEEEALTGRENRITGKNITDRHYIFDIRKKKQVVGRKRKGKLAREKSRNLTPDREEKKASATTPQGKSGSHEIPRGVFSVAA